MFICSARLRRNTSHRQKPLFSDLDYLSDKALKRLENSWAGVFYDGFFYLLDESVFSILYSDKPSRPNIPINVLVGLETLAVGMQSKGRFWMD